MTPTRSIAVCVVAFIAFVTAGSALAQAPQTPPTRLRGSIAAIDDKSVTVATREGATAKVNLADNWGVLLVVPITMADIKENSFVGVASMKGADGTLNALEVLVFPENMRGVGEGHYPWDLQPDSMMTNATVAKVASAPTGQTLSLTYKGDGKQAITVKPGTPIVTFQPGTKEDAKVGAKLLVTATKDADGNLKAARLAVGKDGFTPPM
jgi:hypothetical protein